MATFINAEEKQADSIYDCIVIGAGVSGLQAARNLIEKHGFQSDKVIIVEAQEYVGGRIKQNHTLVPGFPVELGAEILHGQKTLLTKFGEDNNIPIEPIYCWAQGDGGPMQESANGGYGLYYVADKSEGKLTESLLRFDEKTNEDFVEMNEELWELCEIDETKIPPTVSLYDYLHDEGYDPAMLEVAQAGYANTLCNDIKSLPLKQVARWGAQWETEGEEEGDYKFQGGFKSMIDILKSGLDIRLQHIVKSIIHDPSKSTQRVVLSNDQSIEGRTALFTGSVHVLQQSVLEKETTSPAAISFNPPLPESKRLALQSVQLQPAVKVFAAFSRRCWPVGLSGMIVSGNDTLLFPEIWFRSDDTIGHYATGFATAGFAQRLLDLGEDNEVVVQALVHQLATIFSPALLNPSHWLNGVADWEKDTDNGSNPLPVASDVFISGTVQRWSPKHEPFIGGGYASGVCNAENNIGPDYSQVLAEPCGALFFAGEGTNYPAGATAHAAMESGVRAAQQIADFLRDQHQIIENGNNSSEV